MQAGGAEAEGTKPPQRRVQKTPRPGSYRSVTQNMEPAPGSRAKLSRPNGSLHHKSRPTQLKASSSRQAAQGKQLKASSSRQAAQGKQLKANSAAIWNRRAAVSCCGLV